MNNEICRIYVLKFNKVNEAPKEFWDLVNECIDIGKDKDFENALERYWKQEDKTTLFVECNGFFKNDNPKFQAFRRGKFVKDRLVKLGFDKDIIYFQVYRKRVLI